MNQNTIIKLFAFLSCSIWNTCGKPQLPPKTNAWLPSGGSEEPQTKYKLWLFQRVGRPLTAGFYSLVDRLLLREQRGKDIRHDSPACPSVTVPLSFPNHKCPCVAFTLLFCCSHHSVLILLQPGALSSGWQGRMLLRGANQLRQNLK